MTPRYYYIITIGCQMNIYDSSRISALLDSLNYKAVDSFRNADLIVVNTCTIRAKARQKAMSFLGRLALQKRKRPELIIAVGGCVAQQEGRALTEKFPHVDIVFGTHAVIRLPRLLGQVREDRRRVVDIAMTEHIDDEPDLAGRGRCSEKVSDFVTIMRGCDNYCTYCVVPYVRGRETSRWPDRIMDEIRDLAAAGVREVVLLGQNVNSYGNKEGLCSFPQLLAMVNDLEGIARIRFATSHPKDLSDELIRSFGELEKLCNHFHLPVQSGSSRILKSMNRKYTRQQYVERVGKLRQTAPDIAVTTDIIVGFPGETREDFEETASLLSEIEFDGIFGFMYSDRPMTPALKFPGKIPKDEKSWRLNRLFDLQRGISEKKNSALVGETVSVLVEGPSKKSVAGAGVSEPERNQWTGRTTTNKAVNFSLPEVCLPGEAVKPGDVVRVYIDGGFAHSLSGRVVVRDNRAADTGENFHAA